MTTIIPFWIVFLVITNVIDRILIEIYRNVWNVLGKIGENFFRRFIYFKYWISFNFFFLVVVSVLNKWKWKIKTEKAANHQGITWSINKTKFKVNQTKQCNETKKLQKKFYWMSCELSWCIEMITINNNDLTTI